MNPVATTSRSDFFNIITSRSYYSSSPLFRYKDPEGCFWFVMHLPYVTIRCKVDEQDKERKFINATGGENSIGKIIPIFDCCNDTKPF